MEKIDPRCFSIVTHSKKKGGLILIKRCAGMLFSGDKRAEMGESLLPITQVDFRFKLPGKKKKHVDLG